MKKVIALSIFAVLGGLSGYLCAPILSVGIVELTDPEMFAGSSLALYKDLIVCDFDDRPAAESAERLSQYLSALQEAKANNPNSSLLAQEIGLTHIRLSMVEKKLGLQSQADENMKRGQAELAALGWKDVSPVHLTSLVTQLNSEYKRVDAKGKAKAAATAPQ